MYSVRARNSSLSINLTTGSHNEHISSYSIRREHSFCRFMQLVSIPCLLLPIALLLTAFTLLFTLPYTPEGSVVLGTSSVTLLLTLNPSDTDQITINQTVDNFTVLFYDSECSTERESLDLRKSLDVTEQQYRIDELYFVKNSIIHFLFMTPEIPISSSCVAMIHIFSDHLHYFQFISTGQVHEVVSSYCLSPQMPLNFTLPGSAVEEDQFFFVGLESFSTTTINYTITGEQLKYNTTSLFPTTCTFPATDCSISLSGGEDVCILAQLQDKNIFIPLNYTTQSQRRDKQGWTLYAMTFLFMLCTVLCIILACLKLLPHFKYHSPCQLHLPKDPLGVVVEGMQYGSRELEGGAEHDDQVR